MKKSLAAHLAALILLFGSWWIPEGQIRQALVLTALFSLSGALTNWAAVHMLFHRVPGLIGSGVIPTRFPEIREGLYRLTLETFVTDKAYHTVFGELLPARIQDLDVASLLSYDRSFDRLASSLRRSRAGMLFKLPGGEKLVEAMRPLYRKELERQVRQSLGEIDWEGLLRRTFDAASFRSMVGEVVYRRLEETSPAEIKHIVEVLIREQLGWLVVWGAVMGGLLGLIAHLWMARVL